MGAEAAGCGAGVEMGNGATGCNAEEGRQVLGGGGREGTGSQTGA